LTLPLANTYEGGTDGGAITAANSGGASGDAFTAASGTGPVFSTAQAMHGTLSEMVAQGGTPAASYMIWDSTVLTSSSQLYGRAYVRFNSAAPSANARFIQFLSGATLGCGIRQNTTGAIQFDASTGGNTGVGSASAVLSVDTWYRIEWDILFGTGTSAQLSGTVYVGDSTSAFSTFAALNTFTNTITAADTMRIGNPTGFPASPWTIWLDDIQVNNTGVPGPSGGGAPMVRTFNPIPFM